MHFFPVGNRKVFHTLMSHAIKGCAIHRRIVIQTAATFNLSRNTLYLWIRLKKQTGSLKHQVTGLNAVKLERQKLAQYVGQHPDAYLHEIAKHFDCTAATVCYALKQMGMTRKKRPPLTKNKTRPK